MNKNFSRTTITVPHDLKKRMKRTGSKVNWSAVACDAFENKLEEIGPYEEIDTIEGAIERLKASSTETADQSSEAKLPSTAGEAAGRHWALNLASVQQLAALEEFRTEVTPEKWFEILTTRDGWFELTRRIATREAIEQVEDERRMFGEGPREHRGPGRHGRGRHDGHRRRSRGGRGKGKRHGGFRARAFWRSILEERPSEPNFFASFAEGAHSVWEEIKPQIQ